MVKKNTPDHQDPLVCSDVFNFPQVNQEMAFVCPFPFDIIQAYLDTLDDDGEQTDDVKQPKTRRRKTKRS